MSKNNPTKHKRRDDARLTKTKQSASSNNKTRKRLKDPIVERLTPKKAKKQRPRLRFREAFQKTRTRMWERKLNRVKIHTSFRRSYREDYDRPLKAPGLVSHAVSTLKIVFKNWKLFLPLLCIVVGANIVVGGLMDEDTYTTIQDSLEESNEALQYGELGRLAKSSMLLISTVTTGGLKNNLSDVQKLIAILLFIVVWLVVIFVLRHLFAGNHPKLRDALYNAMTPFISTLLVIALIFVHLLPIMFFVILYSTARDTDFLSQPLYAFVFWVFGALLILLSCHLLPVSILSLVAVSVPGIYPLPAIHAATDLIQGRRTQFIIRILFMILFLAVIWVIIMVPLNYIDLVAKDHIEFIEGIPFIPLCLQIMTTFSAIYVTAYIYLFYRRMLDDPN
ncbi:hypothetical protein IKF15_03540 [Candidatus Saccharibacteria bacterium]|nr:hypothetical protein [Candidatus Saccharibacteria bacterium]